MKMKHLTWAMSMILMIGVLVAVATPRADAGVRRFCNRHNIAMASSWGQDIKVMALPVPRDTQTKGRTAFNIGYRLCRRGNKPDLISPNYLAACYTQVGRLGSMVFVGLKIDVNLYDNSGVARGYLGDLHLPVGTLHTGDQRCGSWGFGHPTDSAWIKKSRGVWWRVNYWEETATWPDQHHESPRVYLRPHHDHQIDVLQ